MHVRHYGGAGDTMIVLHGGPGAPGYMAPVARGLAGSFRVLEPFQRGSGEEPLTVSRHVSDLHELIESLDCDTKTALVGSSWGAMLALAYAAQYPDRVGPLVLIGCGTFDLEARDRMQATCEERMSNDIKCRMNELNGKVPDPNKRLKAMGELILPVYSYDLVTALQEIEECDAHAYDETWQDMLRLQDEGFYPAAFNVIESPVLMLHGAVDPHPGRMIQASLAPYIPQLEYHEWEKCGHYPWLERAVRDEFFTVLREWLSRNLSQG